MTAISHEKAISNLKSARWVRDPDCIAIFKALGGLSGRTRAVGGAVRDSLLGRYSMRSDLDFATEMTPNEIIAGAKAAGMSYYPTGLKHGTVTVRHGQVTVEVTTLRQDVETDGRHAKVIFGKDWTADARRRDFSINAMYSTMQGGLFDPLDALDDLINSRVQFIGDANIRIQEDYLRVFRFFRFSSGFGGGTFDPDGLRACAKVADRLDHLSPERVGDELMKLLALPRSGLALCEMVKANILSISPRVLEAQLNYENLSGVPIAIARLAIMFVDKDPSALQSQWRLSNAAVNEARDICAAADYASQRNFHHLAYRFQRIGTVGIAVAGAMQNLSQAEYMKNVKDFHEIEVPRFPVTGDDLLESGFERGPNLGKVLKRIELDWINSGFELDRERLLHRMEVYLSMPF